MPPLSYLYIMTIPSRHCSFLFRKAEFANSLGRSSSSKSRSARGEMSSPFVNRKDYLLHGKPGPNYQRIYQPPMRGKSDVHRYDMDLVLHEMEAAPPTVKKYQRLVEPAVVPAIEQVIEEALPAPVQNPRAKLCSVHMHGVCESGVLCQFAHELDHQEPIFYENPGELFDNVPFKFKRCPKGKNAKLEHCVLGLNCWYRHADEPAGSVCKRFQHFGHCYLDASACPLRH